MWIQWCLYLNGFLCNNIGKDIPCFAFVVNQSSLHSIAYINILITSSTYSIHQRMMLMFLFLIVIIQCDINCWCIFRGGWCNSSRRSREHLSIIRGVTPMVGNIKYKTYHETHHKTYVLANHVLSSKSSNYAAMKWFMWSEVYRGFHALNVQWIVCCAI